MRSTPFKKKQLDGFHEAAQSLKLYRRAELQNASGDSLIEDLYVDPLPNEHIYKTMLKPNTTFLIGRKGSGKSTVFQRAQYGLRNLPGCASAYIDIKTVFESSQVDPGLIQAMRRIDGAMPQESLAQLLLYQAFIKAVIKDIRDSLKSSIKVRIWDRIRRTKSSIDELFEGLDNLLADADAEKFANVTGIRSVTTTGTSQADDETTSNASIGGALGTTSASLKADLGSKDVTKISASQQHQYADILMRVFGIKDYVLRLKELLATVSVSRLYVFVDDFSELPEPAMRMVVDTVLAPLNNWSDELVKFKVAAYPGRVYYGGIDKTKIDEINLDLYSLYGTADVAAMEEKAVDFTRRLVEQRLSYYSPDFEPWFDTAQPDLWRLLFYATMGNPRNLGYILFYVYESQLIYHKLITARSIRDAARRYYEEKIEPYFAINKFLHESFAERSSVYSLKELLDQIVHRARQLRSHTGSIVIQQFKGRPPTSHFHIITDYDALLSTLELNFFLTKYYVMSDRDGRKVSVYALNYGLCQKYIIEFGRPTDRREQRLYFVERIFDFTPILREYMATNQEIVCGVCGRAYEVSQLPSLQLFDMLCPNCKRGQCRVINLSKKYESMLKSVDAALLLPSTELGILHTLQTERRAMFAGEIAGELDCSYQLIGKRGKMLDERGLVERSENTQGKRMFSITEQATKAYFERSPDDELDASDASTL